MKATYAVRRRLVKEPLWLLIGTLLTFVAVVAGLAMSEQGVRLPWQKAETVASTNNTITYVYDDNEERWVVSVESIPLPNNPDGTTPPKSNTIIINIKANDPVKLIAIDEAIIKQGNEPLLEINGHDSGLFGELNIAKLVFDKVDAETLTVDNTTAVKVELQNVAADDNELDIDIDVVNVVRAGRGGTSVLFLGTSQSALFDESKILSGLSSSDIVNLLEITKDGLRVDRIRILGPSSGTGFIEKIIVTRTSVFGDILVDNVNINELVLKDVSLDDSVP